MNEVFADTLYWIALVRPGDPWQEDSRRATEQLGSVHLVTSEEVLTEFLNALSAPAHLRQQAVGTVKRLLSDPGITVLPQSQASFQAGLALFEQRMDKSYSLTDCISMETMRFRSISSILTNDHHFAQEGFRILIVRSNVP